MIKPRYLVFFLSLFSLKIIRWVAATFSLIGLAVYSTIEVHKMAYMTGYTFNLFDVFFYQFGLFMYSFLILIPIYLLIISDTFIDNRLDTYIYVRFSNKKDIWKHKIIQIFIITTSFIILSLLITLIIGGLSFGLPNGWSEGSQKLNSILVQEEFSYISSSFLKLNPLVCLLLLISLIITGLFALGIFVNIFTIIFKKPIISYFVGLSSNFIMLICFKFDHNIDIRIIPYQHYFLIFKENSFDLFKTNSVLFSYFYWFIFILFLILISLRLFTRTNYIFEVKEYD